MAGVRARACSQHLFQCRRPVVLLEQVTDSLIHQLLELLLAIATQSIDGLPSRGVERNQLSGTVAFRHGFTEYYVDV